jgi:hypothetical protein
MPNKYIISRLTGIKAILEGIHKGGATLSSSSKGHEREYFIDKFLAAVMPPIFRFGSGDITDSDENKSGQIDVVIEYPFFPSLPLVGGSNRLYIAEGVAAALEVKSDLSKQWSEVLHTAEQLEKLNRKIAPVIHNGNSQEKIPMFVVGYTGWSSIDTLQKHISEGPIDGVLIIDSGLFLGSRIFKGAIGVNELSLWLFIMAVNDAIRSVALGNADLFTYAK